MLRCGSGWRGAGRCWCSGGRLGDGDADDEARADGLVVLDAKGAVVLGDDAAGNGKAEAGAAFLGGKVRKEEALFIFGRDSVAGVGDFDLNRVAVFVHGGGDGEVADGGAFHGFGGVVDEIGEDAAEEFGVGLDDGEIGGEFGADGDAFEAVAEEGEGLEDGVVEIARGEAGGGKARELPEFADQGFEGASFAVDQVGAFGDEELEFGRAGVFIGGGRALEIALEAFRGEDDRGERIFDFVGDALSDFLPGGGFLGAEKFSEVVENDDEAGIGAARAEGTDSDGSANQAAGNGDFDFARGNAHAEGTAHQRVDDAAGFFADQVFEGARGLGAVAEDGHDGGVATGDFAVGVERNDAGGNVFEDGFHELAAALAVFEGLLEIAGEFVDLALAFAELGGHGVEGFHEGAEFVFTVRGGDAVSKVATGDFFGGFGHGLDGDGNLFGEEEGDPGGGEEEEEGDEEESEEDLIFVDADVLALLLVGGEVVVDGSVVGEEIGAELAGDEESAIGDGSGGGHEDAGVGGPNLCAGGHGVGEVGVRRGDGEGGGAGYGAVGIDDPEGVECGGGSGAG